MATKTFYSTKDASAFSGNDGWSGHDLHHPVGRIYDDSGAFKSFLYFPISWSGISTISSATLYLYGHRAGSGNHCYGATSGSRTLYASRMTSSWDEGTDRGESLWSANETWGYTNRGDAYTTTDQASRAFTTYAEGTQYTLDVTDMVKWWFANQTKNYGFILRNSNNTDPNLALEFYSEDQGGSYRPKLIITYSTNTAPNAPTSVAPASTTSGSPTITTLSPTFSGVFSDPDVSGDASLPGSVNIIVYSGITQTEATKVWEYTGPITSSNWSVVYGGPALVGNATYNFVARNFDKVGDPPGAFCVPHYFKPNSTPSAPAIQVVESSPLDLMTVTPSFSITHNDPDATDNKAYATQFYIYDLNGSFVGDSGQYTLPSPLSSFTLTYGSGALASLAALVPGSTYKWTAKTKDANGAWSEYAPYETITIHKPAKPVNLSPTGTTVISKVNPTYSGQAASTNDVVTEVTIQVWNGATQVGTDIVSGTIVSGQTFSVTYPNSVDQVSGTTYGWCAKVKTSLGYSDYSDLQYYTVNTSSVSPDSPNGATNISSTPTYAFSRASAFRYYQIIVEALSAPGVVFWDSTALDYGSSVTSATKVHAGTALTTGGVQYRWKVRVSNTSLVDVASQTYSGWATFTTQTAAAPVLVSPIGGAWITTTTPSLSISSVASGETITHMRARVYRVGGSADPIWDSGMVDVADATTAAITYSGSTELVGGGEYEWEASYTKTGGVLGPFCARQSFYVNASPVATNLSPASGSSFIGSNPTFSATFYDADTEKKGDYPTEWEIKIYASDGTTLIKTISLKASGGDVAYTPQNGLNSYTYALSPALSVGTTYKWQTRFKDSKSVWGAYSAMYSLVLSQLPVGVITTPPDESTVSSSTVNFAWTYNSTNSLAQKEYRIVVKQTTTAAGGGDDSKADIQKYDSGWIAKTVSSGSSGSHTMPGGYVKSGKRYRAYLYVKDIYDAVSVVDLQAFNVNVNALTQIVTLSVQPEDYLSRVTITWAPQEGSSPSGWAEYRVYRRESGDDDYTLIARINDWNTKKYIDYYAGSGIVYEYAVTQMKTINSDTSVESTFSDDFGISLSSDDWWIIGYDRGSDHIFTLPVQEEEHSRPVQQETFEPLGSDRKVITRGAVLGHEGTMTCAWAEDEVNDAKKQIEYLYATRGPHILKSPWGDVWEVEFAGPSHKYMAAGHLEVSLSYIETSHRTSEL